MIYLLSALPMISLYLPAAPQRRDGLVKNTGSPLLFHQADGAHPLDGFENTQARFRPHR
ncbi:MAG: hypothetical protein H5U22_00780 [Rhizobium sp.]|jgi:hypothetical protein|nr:hypothetical protein [Rhizobium sp.]